MGSAPETRGRGALRSIGGFLVLLLIAFVIALLIKTFFVQAFFVDGASMSPGLVHGDRVLVEKLSYLLHDPRPGDVVVFEKSVFGRPANEPWYRDARNLVTELLGLPTGGETDYIKRVVAGPGDSVLYSGTPRRLSVNGEKQDQSFVEGGSDPSSGTVTEADCERLNMSVSEDGCEVPAGQVFVLGDNRGNSEDSRALGPIDQDKIIGRAFVVIWPPGDLGSI